MCLQAKTRARRMQIFPTKIAAPFWKSSLRQNPICQPPGKAQRGSAQQAKPATKFEIALQTRIACSRFASIDKCDISVNVTCSDRVDIAASSFWYSLHWRKEFFCADSIKSGMSRRFASSTYSADIFH